MSAYESTIAHAIDALDLQRVEETFHAQDRCVFLPRFLPAELVDTMAREAKAFGRQDVHRAHVPWLRKAGAVGQQQIAARAPALYALYRSPAFLALASRLAGAPLGLRHPEDAHAVSLYYYQRPGDFMGFHYDDCGCDAEASFTATFGLVSRGSSRVHVRLFQRQPPPSDAAPRELWLETTPGSLLFFCGTRVHPRVTPLGAGEERIVYSFSYVREGQASRGWRRLRENVSDAIFYFGPRALLQQNYR